MRAVEPLGATDRQPNAVDGQRIVAPDPFENAMRQPTLAHVILGVHFEKVELSGAFEDVVDMLMLQASADVAAVEKLGDRSKVGGSRHSALIAQRKGNENRRVMPVLASQHDHVGRLSAVSEPGPNGVCVLTHVPLSTSFQALPW